MYGQVEFFKMSYNAVFTHEIFISTCRLLSLLKANALFKLQAIGQFERPSSGYFQNQNDMISVPRVTF